MSEEVEYAIWENESRRPYLGFNSAYLLDRSAFTASFDETKGCDSFSDMLNRKYPAATHPDLASNFVWEISVSEKSDAHGWYYALCFETFHDYDESGQSSAGMRCFARRRKWVALQKDQHLQQILTQQPKTDQLYQISSLAGTLLQVAQRFKNSTKHLRKPLLIQLNSAAQLRPADFNGKSDPFVIISVYPVLSDGSLGPLEFSTSSDEVSNSLDPIWNQRILLPGISADYRIIFTVADYDLLSKSDFLGQCSINMSNYEYPLRRTDIELPLGNYKYRLSDYDLGDKKEEGKGHLCFAIDPLPPSVSNAGYLMVKAHIGSLSKLIFGESNYKRQWVVLTGEEIIIYNPGQVLELSTRIKCDEISQISKVLLDDGYSNFVITMSDSQTLWEFKLDVSQGNFVEHNKLEQMWPKKISLASNVDITTVKPGLLHSASEPTIQQVTKLTKQTTVA